MTLTALHVLEALEGGTARHVIDLIEHTPGVRQVVAIPRTRAVGVTDTRARAAMEAAGADVRILNMQRSPIHPTNALALARLTKLVHDERPDVIHAHSSIGGALTRLLPVSTPKVYTPNGLHPGAVARLLERGLGVRTSTLIAVSESERRLALELKLVPPSRVVVIENGIDLEIRPTFDLHSHLGLHTSTRLVGSIARLGWQKAPEDFVAMAVQVARRHEDVHFVLIGDGPQAAEVDALARPLGGRFHRIPSLPGAAAAAASFSVFVLLSRFEGAPYAPLEAARAGVPLVLTDVVGSRDVVVSEESGVLVPLGDTPAAAAAVQHVLEDSSWRDDLTLAMTKRLRERFDVRRQGAAHHELYERLAPRSCSGPHRAESR